MRLTKKGTPFLGICLGLQLLFERSDESTGCGRSWSSERGYSADCRITEGLRFRIWAGIHWTFRNEGRLFKGLGEDPYVYFVHSYYLKAEEEEIVTATDGIWTYDSRFCREG